MQTQSRRQQHRLMKTMLDSLPGDRYAIRSRGRRRLPIHTVDAAEIAWRELQHLDPPDAAEASANILAAWPDLEFDPWPGPGGF